MKTNAEIIQTLAESPTYREYERAFNEATELPLSITHVDFLQLPLHGKARENNFCAMVASASGACSGCLQAREKLCNSATEGPAATLCGYGLAEAAAPIRLGNRVIGYLQTGQVHAKKPTEAQIEKAVAAALAGGVKKSSDELRQAYERTPVVAQKKLLSVAQILSAFASHLSTMTNQMVLQESHAEPPLVTRAKEFIMAHLDEDITLGQVAQAVHTSMFYFCKMFKKFTGLTFTEFVSRCRIEKAKELLLNPHKHVSEVAYEVGFQSLTHFNRVFRQLMGEPPTSWRTRQAA